MAELTNPFSIDITFDLLKKEISANGEKLGTYGVIKGAQDFIAASVGKGELSLEALGYTFEELILYVTSLGLGTCWLGVPCWVSNRQKEGIRIHYKKGG